ncbi:MAG: disulfide bond formation protein DsbA [Gammaproteobacteria bacterium]|nr:disulfide bond formation protein DsbA [Gammaproteobacteria bacterium]
MTLEVVHYFDYKSPYAYLAQAPTDKLEAKYRIRIQRVPYTLYIPDFLGAAELDATGTDIVGTRSEHQWRRVRYSYMDCRREANRLGLTIRGPRKIWDSSLAHIGFLYAHEQDNFRAYHRVVYERFWRRELDIEDIAVLLAVMNETGIDVEGFTRFAGGSGRELHDELQAKAEAAGIFGVPSWTVNDELFWGSERLGLVEEAISQIQDSTRR